MSNKGNSFAALNGSSGSVDTSGNVKKKRNRKKKIGGNQEEQAFDQAAEQAKLKAPEPQGWKVVGTKEEIPPGMESIACSPL